MSAAISRSDFLAAFALVETVKAHRLAAESKNNALLLQGVSESERELKVLASVPREFGWVAADVFVGRPPAEIGWFLQAPFVSRPSAVSEPPHE